MISKGEAELVWVGGLISRIIAQTCRQSGLSQVYTELLSFQGEEIYFKAEPSLAGKAFGEVLSAYEKCSVLGLQRASGEVRLLPPMDARLEAGDKVIVVAQDDDAIQLSNRADVGVKAELLQAPAAREIQPERTLVLGWNWRATSILRELDQYIAPGSEALVVADVEEDEAQRMLDELVADLKHQTVRFQRGDTTHRRTLDNLQVSGFDHIILLCYSDTLDVQRADARTLVTLLHLRDLADRAGRSFAIVSEMLDLRNRALAEVAKVDDFIVSERLISLMLAQVAENKSLNAVFADLFDPEGAEVYLKPAGHYVALGQPVNFYTVVEAARRRGECALGYRLAVHAQEADKSYGVTLNPDKSRAVSFGPLDKVVVLAES
jgi:voltage-gated potassium channel Kch